MTTCGNVKGALEDYQGALEDLDKTHVFYSTNAFILTICGNVKGALKDYERALDDLDKSHVFDSTNAFTLTTHGGPNMVKYAKKSNPKHANIGHS